MNPASPDRLAAALSGRYRIERELGAGGMATVYLAFDEKHDRKVAIKVLKPELAAVLGAERFVVEIKTTAAMSHPHILPLFDSGTADGFLFYVMPYIQGETIREKLNRETQFGVDEAVRIAREVADALDYAHRHGVIHRDIKPENILLHDGRAMVMDFGIALAVSAAAGGRMTETGLSLGTPHYMSPEQATAEKEITARSDQYSLASVLYEMLTGNAPFTGAAAQQIIMKIITEPAEPVTKYRKSVPPNVVAAVAKALEKLPADRFESAKTFADALANAHFTHAGGVHAGAGPAASAGTLVRRVLPWAIATAAIVIVGIVSWRVQSDPAPQETRLSVALRGLDPAGGVNSVAVSPDGRTVIFLAASDGVRRIYRRSLDDTEPRVLAGSDGVEMATFSPDGNALLFSTGDGTVKRIPSDGGAAVTLREKVLPQGLAWSSRAGIVLGMQRLTPNMSGLTVISASRDTTLRVVTDAGTSDMHHFPVLLDDDRTALFTHFAGTRQQLGVVSLDGGEAETLDFDLDRIIGVLDGVLVYTEGSDLMAVAFDERRKRPLGPSIRVGDLEGRVAGATLSRNGTLVLVLRQSGYQAVIVDESGKGEPIISDTITNFFPRYSPDGRRVAVGGNFRRSNAVWILDVGTRNLSKLSAVPGEQRPRFGAIDWSGDGRRLLRLLNPTLFWQGAEAGDAATPFSRVPEGASSISLAPNQEHLAINERGDVSVRRLNSDTGAVPLAASNAAEGSPRFSPDGRWVAYASDESGRSEVYMKPYPGPGARVQLSDGGGSEPVWAPGGKRLFYRSGPALVAAEIEWAGTPTVKRRQQLFVGDYYSPLAGLPAGYDVAPDGRHFIMARGVGAGGAELEVWTGWLLALKKRLVAGK